MTNIIQFPGLTLKQLDPYIVLENTKGLLKEFYLIGIAHDGSEYITGTSINLERAHWILSRGQRLVMDMADEDYE